MNLAPPISVDVCHRCQKRGEVVVIPTKAGYKPHCGDCIEAISPVLPDAEEPKASGDFFSSDEYRAAVEARKERREKIAPIVRKIEEALLSARGGVRKVRNGIETDKIILPCPWCSYENAKWEGDKARLICPACARHKEASEFLKGKRNMPHKELYGFREVERKVWTSDDADLDRHAEAIEAAKRSVVEGMLEIGRHLQAVQQKLGGKGRDGEFLPWVQDRCGFTSRTAYNYLSAFKVFGALKCETVSHFDQSAMYLLASDSAPEAAAEKAIGLAKKGEHITRGIAKEIIAEFTEPASDAINVEIEESDVQEPAEEGAWAMQFLLESRRFVAEWSRKAPVEDWGWISNTLRDLASKLDEKAKARATEAGGAKCS